MKRPEILSPAGDLERLKFAVLYGADAVYVGATEFGMRSAPKNFTMEQLAEGVRFAHARGRRVYLTLNTVPTNEEIARMPDFMRRARETGVDAFIVADLGVLAMAKHIAPEMELHVSTQAGIANYAAASAAYDLGAKRVVLARELSLNDIAVIRDNTPPELELEAFVHGAMCMSHSGRCLLSNFMVGRDANRGNCAQPCRWKYAVVEESRPGEYLPVYENERGTYIFNSKDLCMIEHIPDLLDAGIDSYKIEGRMKTALYVATVARTYRKAIDDYLESPKKYEENMEWYRDQISNCTYRQFTTGFFYGKPDHESQIYDSNTYVKEYTYLGIVGEKNEKSRYAIEQRNKFSVGEEIEVMKPDGENVCVTVKGIWDDEGNQMESAPHPKQKLWIDLGVELDRFDILRRKEME